MDGRIDDYVDCELWHRSLHPNKHKQKNCFRLHSIRRKYLCSLTEKIKLNGAVSRTSTVVVHCAYHFEDVYFFVIFSGLFDRVEWGRNISRWPFHSYCYGRRWRPTSQQMSNENEWTLASLIYTHLALFLQPEYIFAIAVIFLCLHTSCPEFEMRSIDLFRWCASIGNLLEEQFVVDVLAATSVENAMVWLSSTFNNIHYNHYSMYNIQYICIHIILYLLPQNAMEKMIGASYWVSICAISVQPCAKEIEQRHHTVRRNSFHILDAKVKKNK